MITIEKFPMPPSVNELYINIRMRGRPGRVKSSEYKAYISLCQLWAKLNSRLIDSFKAELQTLKKDQVLQIDSIFYFGYASIITKDGRPKRNDTSNRIKALDDQISAILGIDDCKFWAGSYDKKLTNLEQNDHVSIKITPIQIPKPS